MQKLEEFKKKLQEIFEMDKSDLDFGIYRIMNHKRKEINQFIENLGTDIIEEFSKLKDENFNQGQLKLELVTDLDSESSQVFSNLITFFNRYYVEGDFISQRRYKEGVYAIPYEGEEVKLHWANSDQYYIKNTENFNNYSVKLNDKTLNFKISEAETEMNNNKEVKGKERRFLLSQDNPLEILEDEINIYFNYTLNQEKQDKLNELAKQKISELLKVENEEIHNMVFQLSPTEKNKNRTLFEKELLDYTSKNTFDYFIHKNLGEFLRRELDFFIKNEVLFIDDLNEEKIKSTIGRAKVIKSIGHKVIDFLAQVEDFEKKLWEKKKFIVETNYCITLDKIPEEFYEEIIENKEQQEAWKELFGIEKNIQNLEENPYLVLDTKHFSQSFKENLIASIDNLDENINGIMINSDNYHAINFLRKKYKEQIKAFYLDPPYNTNASEIIYKNGYKNSSWLCLMENRLSLAFDLLRNDSISCFTIDDFEVEKLQMLLTQIYGKDNLLGVCPIRNNPAGRSTTKGFSITHEYGIFYSKTDKFLVGRLGRNQAQLDRYDQMDEKGKYEWVNYRKPGSTKEESPKMYYPIFINENRIKIPEIKWDDFEKEWILLEEPQEKEIILYPIDENGQKRRWRWSVERFKLEPSEFKVGIDRSRNAGVYMKGRMNNEGILPFTWWDKKEYSSTAYGTNLLKDLFLKLQAFSYPKSLFAVMDSLRVLNLEENAIVLDFFAGSGTTGHATIELNREDNGNRKYILVEMGEYFNKITRPRVMKSVYSANWKNGKPLSPETGISHIMKYFKLEQYEDTLNNLSVSNKLAQQDIFSNNKALQDEYTMKYMLEFDTRGSQSLLNIDQFKDPFNYKMNIVENNEIKSKTMDLVETFNYLIGLEVEKNQATRYFNFEGEKLRETTDGNYKIKEIIGKTRSGERVLIIWRNRTSDIVKDNKIIEEFFRKNRYKVGDNEFSKIYINGDNTLQNIKTNESWKVELLEEKFKQMMFNDQGL